MPKRDGGASSDFRIFETEEFQKKLRKLPARESRFIQQKLTEYVYPQLRVDPLPSYTTLIFRVISGSLSTDRTQGRSVVPIR